MNDLSTPRTVLKLKLKPAILETLNNKLPKPLITASNEIKTQAPRIDKSGDNNLKDQTLNKNKEPKQKPKVKVY